MKTIVIGSGLSGLTAAATLAQAGHEVAVIEQFDHPGGITAGYEQDGFRWDLGQLNVEGFGPDEPVGRVLARIGVLDKIEAIKDERGYAFPDFELRKPAEYAGPRWRIERLKDLFPAEHVGLERYWRDYTRFTRLMTAVRNADFASGPKGIYWKVRLYLALAPFIPRLKWSAQRLMEDYFKDPRLHLVFVSILADFFTPPEKFPGLGVFALNPETFYDLRIPKRLEKGAEQVYLYSLRGGMHSLVQALVERIQACGGHVYTKCPASKILIAQNRVLGVIAGGQRFPADVVVASGGAKEIFCNLVGEDLLPSDFVHTVHELPLMDSVFMLHLGVDFDPRPAIHGVSTYYYGSYDLAGAIAEAKDGIYHQGERGFVVHVPSLHSPEMAPAGCHTVTIYTIAPDRLKDGTWNEHKETFADRLLAYAEQHIPGLSQHVVACNILTPEDFRLRTHLSHHAFGGLAPWIDAKRIPHKTSVKGLWFIGAQSESGGGVNSVILGAYKTAQKIQNKKPSPR